MFSIFSATCFCMDFWCDLASVLAPCWHPFAIIFHVFWWSIFGWFFRWYYSRFLLILDQNWLQKLMSPCSSFARFSAQGAPQSAPKTHPRRNLDFHWFFMDLGSHFGGILTILAPNFIGFCRQHRQFLPASHIELPLLKWPASWGCGGDALRPRGPPRPRR